MATTLIQKVCFLAAGAFLVACQSQAAPVDAVPTETPEAQTRGQGRGQGPGGAPPGGPITGTGQFRGQGPGGSITDTAQFRGGQGFTGTFTGTGQIRGGQGPTGTGQFRGPGAAGGQSPTSTVQIVAGAGTPVPIAQATAVPTRSTTTNASVSATGALALSNPQIAVGFETSGKVLSVKVVPGQAVRKGDTLAELDPTDLQTAITQARDALALKQTSIAASLEPAKQADIDAANLALSIAYASYVDLTKGPDATTVGNALRSWNQAKNSLYSTQLSRDTSCRLGPGEPPGAAEKAAGEVGCKSAQLGMPGAETRERNAYQAYLDAQKPATQDALAKAWSSVASAQSSLATLKNGVSAEQKRVYALQIKQASLTIERAERDLAKAKLLSPCDCVVQAVTLTAGSTAGGSVTLLNAAALTFKATNISERDVINVSPGQSATVRLKAFDQTFSGKVSAILPIASGIQGTTALYTVLIDLDATTATLLPGMTGTAEIRLR